MKIKCSAWDLPMQTCRTFCFAKLALISKYTLVKALSLDYFPIFTLIEWIVL